MNYFDLTSLNHDVAKQSYTRFEDLVAKLMKLLEMGVVYQLGFSAGKDSSTVLNATIEAMRRCIESGIIEADHPLVVITVDTLLEPYNIQTYVPFAHNQVRETCEQYGINLTMSIVSPPLHQQLMVLYAGTQKLFATAASGRSADCSTVWKLDLAKRSLSKAVKSLAPKYQQAKWVNLSGVRLDESQRRKANINKRGQSYTSADALLDELNQEGEGYGFHRFAPIADWTTRDVIDCLSHAGGNPIKRMPIGMSIPCYGNNFGLLLAIYGEGSNDVCQVTDGGSCGGVARYGCQTCGLVSEDVSGQEMLQYPRWSRFGDDVVRFRDYLVRSSTMIEHRAFHPRATCSVTSNVYLQPNVLKAKTLEYIIYQASQITEKQQHIHRKFCEQLAHGNIYEDEGVVDIMEDRSLRSDVKDEYVEAYIARMSAKPMLELFTEKHAVMLSALWSLHGLNSAPYRPMKILDNVRKGHRKPMPMLNNELNAALAAKGLPKWDDTSILNKEIPDALVYQLFSPARRFDASIVESDALSHWLPIDFTKSNIHHHAPLLRGLNNELIHRDRLRPANTLLLKVQLSTDGTNHNLWASRVPSGIFPITKGSAAYQELLTLALDKMDRELAKVGATYAKSVEQVLSDVLKANGTFKLEFYTEVPFARTFTSAFSGVTHTPKTRKQAGLRFTRRKRTKVGNGLFTAGRTSLQDYTPSDQPALVEQHRVDVGYWLPDTKETRAQQFSLYDYDMDEEFVQNLDLSMDFLESKFAKFMKTHWESAISAHDNYVRDGFSKRTGARKYGGTGAFHSLMKVSGLQMSPRFQAYVNRSLVRTEIFHASSIFTLSDMPHSDIAQINGVISMDEHRSQKANQLLAVRRARNIKRAELRDMLSGKRANTLVRTVSQRVIEFLTHFEKQALSMAIHASHQAFTGRPDLSLNGNINEIWMQQFSPCATGFDSLVKMLSSKEELTALRHNLESMQTVFEVYRNKTALVSRSLSQRCNQIVDCLLDIHQKAGECDLDDDGMGNFEFKDPSMASQLVDAYVAAGATRNRFLTEMAFSNTLAVAKGLRKESKEIANARFTGAATALQSSIAATVATFNAIDFDSMIRKVVTLECRTSTIGPLSDEKRARLAALRAAN